MVSSRIEIGAFERDLAIENTPQIQWDARGHDSNTDASNDPTGNNHGEGAGAGGPSDEGDAETHNYGASQGGESATKIVAGRVRQEDIADPCAKIVDRGDDALLGGAGVIDLLDKARVDKYGGENADIISE